MRDVTRDAATQRQVDAADPDRSTWLSANAGSGKTRVLTDRVARLLLGGVDPQNILCLTYTKAAASEMQNRLFRRLGEWAMKQDAALADDLRRLGVEGTVDAARLCRARTLFARAIETPGGLKIQTIHSFCASLLRRFPLEARVSPQFTEMEDRAAALLRAEVVDEMAMDHRVDLVDGLARHFTGEDFDRLLAEITARRDQFAGMPEDAALCDLLDLDEMLTPDTLLAQVLPPSEAALIADLRTLCRTGSATDRRAAEKLDAIDCNAPPTLAHLAILEDVLLTGDSAKVPFGAKIGKVPTKDLRKANPDLCAALDDLMQRVEDARPERLKLLALERTRTLYAFATVFVPAYEDRKLRRGMLDFDDLIRKARALLTDPQVAQWVLFRLDGGIDHVLVDEAQDTSPDQWAVVERLTQEFAAGIGAHPNRQRTIFVVGDKKQSIYSFQGADPDEFDRMRDHFDAALRDPGPPLNALSLDHSFRSSAAILRVVDATFSDDMRDGLGDEVMHLAFHASLPGRVDLWPAIAKAEDDEGERDWTDPVDRISATHHTVLLANRIAAQIARMLESGTIPDRTKENGIVQRAITAGDILILVQRRSELFAEIIRACKEQGLDVAGADRLKVGAELAVRDIAALLSFLALPEDDLSLAAALKSPLFGWTEAQLYALAQPRPDRAYLWTALKEAEAEHRETLGVLHDLRRQADFLRPYDLIERILTRHGGRARLLARLGDEAEDGIDALLSQALSYERSEVPGLTGFLNWMETDDLEIKRQMDSAGDRIRVMTVHGAKGLEAPIVILPDTAKRPIRVGGELLRDGDHVLWRTPAAQTPPAMRLLQDAALAAQERERRRLLYVAMTRAETWLIVCAAGETGQGGESWYGMAEAGLRAAGAKAQVFDFGGDPATGLRYDHLDWSALPRATVTRVEKTAQTAPGFALVPVSEGATGTLSPSDLGGAKVLQDGDAEGDAEIAKARGTLMHLLLEHLPLVPPAERQGIGRALLEGTEAAAGIGDAATLLAEAFAMIEMPALSAIFDPSALAEVEVTAALDQLGGARLHGAVDRLLIGADRILAIDFKTNRKVPDRPDEVPEGLLRQMGAYRAMLEQVWPGREVETAILWTAKGRLMPLPAQLVGAALRRATIP